MIPQICEATGASSATRAERIQSLWSGWGEIARYSLEGASVPSVIVKRVEPPSEGRHPRGWNSSMSNRRKQRSYEVERVFWRDYAAGCPARVPRVFLSEPGLFVLEDLDASGFPGRLVRRSSERELEWMVQWLAEFHRHFLGNAGAGLWEKGTYWHLATRPDEWQEMAASPLKDAAGALDASLSGARFQTIVHGDAKVANFCFGEHGVAAVDFQYAGRGVGVKDLAYLLGSCLGDGALFREAAFWTDRYFEHLSLPDVEEEWRELVPLAWADFERFLAGWAPEHSKRTGFASEQVRIALGRLGAG